MKTSLKVSLLAVMAGALALVILLGASIGSAAPPNPALSDDLVLIGAGRSDGGTTGTGEVNVFDVNSMSVVNRIAKSSDGSGLANNHGVLIDGTGRYIWNTNHFIPAPITPTSKAKVVKYDLQTMSTVATFEAASADVYAFTGGFCGLEWNNNDPSTGKFWATSMSTGVGNGGLYEFDATTGATGVFIDNTAGADLGATCGIAWNTSGSTAYAAAMSAKKTSSLAWPGGAMGTTYVHTTAVHMLDTSKADNLAYVAAETKIDIINTTTMGLVGSVAPVGYTPAIHDTKVAHGGGFLYAHSRTGSTSPWALETGTLLVYDIGGGGAGGTKLAPVLIGSAPDEGSFNVSCGTQLLSKAAYTGQPGLSLSKTSTAWGSWGDYLAGILTVNYSVGNSGSYAALSTSIVGSASTNGVTLNSTVPVSLGTIGTGSSKALSLKYNVPNGVGSFFSTTYATANDLGGTGYAYPTAYPGP